MTSSDFFRTAAGLFLETSSIGVVDFLSALAQRVVCSGQVGGTREIKVPAVMGYGAKRTGPIPANSDLLFKVELIGLG